MLGAIIGDMVGSIYEFDNTKRMDFPFFSENSTYTDDSIMTLAVAEWLLSDNTHSHETKKKIMGVFSTEAPIKNKNLSYFYFMFTIMLARSHENFDAKIYRLFV